MIDTNKIIKNIYSYTEVGFQDVVYDLCVAYDEQQIVNNRMKKALLDIIKHMEIIGGELTQYSTIYNMCMMGLGIHKKEEE